MNLNTLKPNNGSKHRRKRLGCGESSGHGKTSGRGGKGQSARSGGSIRIGFEGGQMPLIRRLPKRGFNNSRFSDRYAVLNLDQFDVFSDNETVDREAIIAKGILRRSAGSIKVLGRGTISKKLHIVADAFSAAASSAIVAAGGTASISNARG